MEYKPTNYIYKPIRCKVSDMLISFWESNLDCAEVVLSPMEKYSSLASCRNSVYKSARRLKLGISTAIRDDKIYLIKKTATTIGE